jgi:hypothetical protein
MLIVGQLLTHPLHPERECFYSNTAHEEVDDLNDYQIKLRYKDLYSLDQEGRFLTNYGARFDLGRVYRQPNLLTVKAEQMIQRTSQDSTAVFEAVCNDPDARTWIYDTVKAGKPLYIVLGITELKNAVFKRARLQDNGASSREPPRQTWALVGSELIPRYLVSSAWTLDVSLLRYLHRQRHTTCLICSTDGCITMSNVMGPRSS